MKTTHQSLHQQIASARSQRERRRLTQPPGDEYPCTNCGEWVDGSDLTTTDNGKICLICCVAINGGAA